MMYRGLCIYRRYVLWHIGHMGRSGVTGRKIPPRSSEAHETGNTSFTSLHPDAHCCGPATILSSEAVAPRDASDADRCLRAQRERLVHIEARLGSTLMDSTLTSSLHDAHLALPFHHISRSRWYTLSIARYVPLWTAKGSSTKHQIAAGARTLL